jgi:hypothetical protein
MAFAIGYRKKSVEKMSASAIPNRFFTTQRANWTLLVSRAWETGSLDMLPPDTDQPT